MRLESRNNFRKIFAIVPLTVLLLSVTAHATPRIRWRDLSSTRSVFGSEKRFKGERVFCVSSGAAYRASFVRKKPGSRKQRQYRPVSKAIDLLSGRVYEKSSREYEKASVKYERYRAACNPAPTPTASPTLTATPSPTSTPGTLVDGFALTGSPSSLAPYVGAWSGRHVSHLLIKVGLGGNTELYNFGLLNGRASLVAKLLEAEASASDLAGVQDLGQTLDQHAYESAKSGAFTATGDVCKTYKLFAGKSSRYYDYVYSTKGAALASYMEYLMQDHFSVNLDQTIDSSFCTRTYGTKVYVDAIRSHALGNFGDMLRDFVRFDIMMNGWLDNSQNKRIAINENFARELMELYTHGICPRDGSDCATVQNYYEPTVREMARALTGFVAQGMTGVSQFPDNYFWNWDGSTTQQVIAFTPNQNFYDPDAKTLYEGTPYQTAALPFTTTWAWDATRGDTQIRSAQSIPALEYTLSLQATREQIAHKMFSQLAYPNPPPELTAQLAQVLLNNDFNLSKLAEVILNSDAMYSPLTQDSYISSPFENVMTFLRVSGLNAALLNGSQYALLDGILNKANNQPLAPPDVFGFRGGGVNRAAEEDNRGEIWLSAQSLLARQNGMMQLADTLAFGPNYSFDSFVPTVGKSAQEILNQAAIRFDVSLTTSQRDRVLAYLNEGGGFDSLPASKRKARLAGLITILSNTTSALLK